MIRGLQVATCLLAFALRVGPSAFDDLWLDEAVFALNSSKIEEIYELTITRNSAPILMPLLVHPWSFIGDYGGGRLIGLVAGLMLPVFVVFAYKVLSLSRSFCLAAGFGISIAPAMVAYSSELREYGLGASLVAVLALLAKRELDPKVSSSAERGGLRAFFLLLCGLLPFLSYSAAMTCVAFVVALIFTTMGKNRFFVVSLLTTTGSSVASFVLFARHQSRVASWSYLENHYPPDNFGLDYLVWLVFEVPGPLSAGLSFPFPDALSLLLRLVVYGALYFALAIISLRLLRRPEHVREGQDSKFSERSEEQRWEKAVLLSVLLYLAGVFVLSVLGTYPIGPIRQHIAIIPMVIFGLASLWSTQTEWSRPRQRLAKMGLVVFYVPVSLVSSALISQQSNDFAKELREIGISGEVRIVGHPQIKPLIEANSIDAGITFPVIGLDFPLDPLESMPQLFDASGKDVSGSVRILLPGLGEGELRKAILLSKESGCEYLVEGQTRNFTVLKGDCETQGVLGND